LTTRRTLTQRS